MILATVQIIAQEESIVRRQVVLTTGADKEGQGLTIVGHGGIGRHQAAMRGVKGVLLVESIEPAPFTMDRIGIAQTARLVFNGMMDPIGS